MSDEKKSRPSFSPASRWRIAFDVVLRTALVLAVAVMLNYLGARYYHRFYLSTPQSVQLSSRTLNILHSLTNHVEVTLYYDTHDAENFYQDIVDLLDAYRDANKNISIQTVDYERDGGMAMKVKEKYNLPVSAAAPNSPPYKDLIIFACGDRHYVIPGELIVGTRTEVKRRDDPDYDADAGGTQFRQKPVSFNGEVMFTSKILSLSHAQPLKAYFLQGHGESSFSDTSKNGYQKFLMTLAQNDMVMDNLEIAGETEIPADCSLLVIAGPVQAFQESELHKIDEYLRQGGKLMVLLNYDSRLQPTGIEAILQHWNVNVLPDYVKDSQFSGSEQWVLVRNFNPKTFVAPLTQLALEMVLPRPIASMGTPAQAANAPVAEALVSSSPSSTLGGDTATAPRAYPLIVSVEQKPVAGVTNPRGNTRIVVAGDSFFLDNYYIEGGKNRDFLNYAVNWLANRDEMLQGIGPRPVDEFRLTLSPKQNKQLRWLLLGAMPGGVLAFGWLVWLVRRK